MKTLANKTVLKLGPELGLCIALHSSSMPDHATGHLFQGKPGREYGTHPAPDLKAVVILWTGTVEIEALTEDGQAFLDLVAA